jgi:hypothetical protein
LIISTCPVILFIQIYIVNPSGYWGANKSIRHTGKKKTATSAPEAKATRILDVVVR